MRGVWSAGTVTEPQVKFSISLISCDVHSLVKRDVQLDVKRNDRPSRMIQSDALSCQLMWTSSSFFPPLLSLHLNVGLTLLR